ncbi:MAG: hypothetical protein WBL74_05235 [Novosphingobium sp.]|uniref:hypothetical protein n=1 Tax=Novosphingobium sp. TaxID=1874826 RepID=UPI003C7D56DB
MIERIASLAVLGAVLAAVVYGWLHRYEDWINPERGIGYALGIIGGVLMLVLLGYPLRKRAKRTTRAVGSVGFWFRFHMFLGLVGPLAILYHARFSWGALNSAMALGAMIVVASSGLVGRFFYSRVHRGYSGRKLELRSLKQEMDAMLMRLEAAGLNRDTVIAAIQPFEDRAVRAGSGFWTSAGAVISLGIETRIAARRLLGSVPRGADRRLITVREQLTEYFDAVRRTAEFAFYDRLLRLWHLLHLPLFFLLVAAAILHIVAVHMY